MRFLVGLIVVAGLALGGWQLYQYWGNFKEKPPVQAAPAQPQISGTDLPGMVPRLEPILEVSERRGAAGLNDFLDTYANTINDPRRAWIELDYVVLVAESNPAEARRVFAKVKSRIGPSSPVYGRVQLLEKTFD